jgi:(p)ppGpp synthase/HD superfamily hydrolase
MARHRIIAIAERLARDAHKGHTRSNRADTPYAFHLEEVATLVEEAHGSPWEIATGWVHDAPEDTSLTLGDVRVKLGVKVSFMTEHLTDLPEWRNLPTLERKTNQATRVALLKLERMHDLTLISGVQRVKLADQISNVRCVRTDPPLKWGAAKVRHYIEGARRIALVCRGVSTYLDDLFEQEYREAYQTCVY